jgi:hypothetical protein
MLTRPGTGISKEVGEEIIKGCLEINIRKRL